MKTKIALFFIVTSFNFLSAQMALSFGYDTAGNQTQRNLINILIQKNNSVETFALADGDELKYWPNPVADYLNIEWFNDDERYCNNLSILNNQGKLLFSKDYRDDENIDRIDFSQFSVGMYFIKLSYSNKEQKQIKIIKKE
jgi:hypothetical protein